MHPITLRLTEEIAADFKARVKALDLGAIEKARKGGDQNGTFDVIISTEDTDRSGEIVKQNGWELTNYKNNPIVLWGHDYYSLPIGVCTETYLTEKNGVPALGARGVFLSAEINPFAQQVRKLYEFGIGKGAGVGCTTSVGFIPKEFDENARNTITKAELLEFSFVPIPANQGVGPAAGRSLTFDEAKQLGLDVAGMRVKGVNFTEIRGFIPAEANETKAAIETKWEKLTLKDFTDASWDDLSPSVKSAIAAHYAYSLDPELKSFDDLKLPYRRATDGAVVFNGLKSAMTALLTERSGIELANDKKAVYEHLAKQYELFGKTAPEFKTKEAQAGDACQTDDGSPGVLATDPKDPDGALVCLPQDDDKSIAKGHASQKALLKSLGDEHERHVGEVDKAFDDFKDKTSNGEQDEKKKAAGMREAFKDLRSALADEHTMHRAKSVAAFRDFDPAENKAFDKKPHLKTLRDEHEAYDTKCEKSLDQFEEKCTKGVKSDGTSSDENTDWMTDQTEGHQRAHKKAVVKIAKAMCKEAFGEEDQADEKVLAILGEHLAAYVPEPLQRAVFQKVGARISAASKEKLGEAHQHLKAATAIVEALHGGLGNDDGEEGRSDEDDKSLAPAPTNKRSRPAEAVRDDELDTHLLTRDILRGVTTAAQRGLEQLKKARQ